MKTSLLNYLYDGKVQVASKHSGMIPDKCLNVEFMALLMTFRACSLFFCFKC